MTKYCEEVSLNLERISQQIEKMEEQIKLGVNRKERRIMLSQIQQACCYLNKVDMLSHLDDEKKLTEEKHQIITSCIKRLIKCFDNC